MTTHPVTPGSPLAAAPTWLPLLAARSHWRQIDFISDLHLHVGDPATFAAWQHYLQHTTAQAVVMLGDLFEVWVGDDVLSRTEPGATDDTAFEQSCVQVLQQASNRMDLFFMCGNRDFLVGARCLRDAGVQGLDDPCVLVLGASRWLLSHGDAMCLDDIAYQQFRTLVRSTAWQAGFLAQPLAARQATARQLRAQSEQHKRAQPVLVDVDTYAAQRQMQASATSVLIHGHTHQPADHVLADGLRRIVLSDWDLQATPPRAQVLRLQLDPSGEPTDVRRMPPSDAC